MTPWYLYIGPLSLCQAAQGGREWCSRHSSKAMQKSSGIVLAPPPRSRKSSARVALVDIKEPARALLVDCFKQFGIEAVVLTGNVRERLDRQKLAACVVPLAPEAAAVTE